MSLMICGTGLLSFLAGALFTFYFYRTKPVEASGNRVFELMIYHTLPGKASDLESVFRRSYKLQARYGLDVIGYWVLNENPCPHRTGVNSFPESIHEFIHEHEECPCYNN